MPEKEEEERCQRFVNLAAFEAACNNDEFAEVFMGFAKRARRRIWVVPRLIVQPACPV